jgi:hypothetical protein
MDEVQKVLINCRLFLTVNFSVIICYYKTELPYHCYIITNKNYLNSYSKCSEYIYQKIKIKRKLSDSRSPDLDWKHEPQDLNSANGSIDLWHFLYTVP